MAQNGVTKTEAHADKDGHFRRKDSAFRDWISKDPNAKFPAERGRYALYMNYGCPWAHRTSIVRALKGLEDVIQMIPTDFDLTANGWTFTGKNGSQGKDPLYGFSGLKELYLMVDPEYTGRYTVPCLFDKKTETIVNNESSELIRMFYTEFDDFVADELKEASKKGGGLYPEQLRNEIDEMNEWVYNTVNNVGSWLFCCAARYSSVATGGLQVWLCHHSRSVRHQYLPTIRVSRSTREASCCT